MLSIVREDTIKIETSEYPDQNIFLPFREVTLPELETAQHLLSWMNNALPVATTGGGGGGQGLATEATLLLLLAEFIKVKLILEKIGQQIDQHINNGDITNRPADLTDTSEPDIIYRGWVDSAHSGTGLDSAIWAIQREDTKNVPSIKTWADGNRNFDNVWNDRYHLDYM